MKLYEKIMAMESPSNQEYYSAGFKRAQRQAADIVIMKHYTIKKDGLMINAFASEKAILEMTGCEDIKEAIKLLREDGYVVNEVKKW